MPYKSHVPNIPAMGSIIFRVQGSTYIKAHDLLTHCQWKTQDLGKSHNECHKWINSQTDSELVHLGSSPMYHSSNEYIYVSTHGANYSDSQD